MCSLQQHPNIIFTFLLLPASAELLPCGLLLSSPDLELLIPFLPPRRFLPLKLAVSGVISGAILLLLCCFPLFLLLENENGGKRGRRKGAVLHINTFFLRRAGSALQNTGPLPPHKWVVAPAPFKRGPFSPPLVAAEIREKGARHI